MPVLKALRPEQMNATFEIKPKKQTGIIFSF